MTNLSNDDQAMELGNLDKAVDERVGEGGKSEKDQQWSAFGLSPFVSNGQHLPYPLSPGSRNM